jgi:hypothetical protein
MQRTGRLALSLLAALFVLAPAAQAAPTITAGERSSGVKGMGSITNFPATGMTTIGDPGPEPPPRLFVHTATDVTVTLDETVDAFRAYVGDAVVPAQQTGPRTYVIDVPDGQALPVFVGFEIKQSDAEKTETAWYSAELAASPVPRLSTAWTAPVAPALLSAIEGPRGGPIAIADGFGLNPPTLRAAPGATVTIKLTGWVNWLTAHVGVTPLAATKVDDTTYTVALPADVVLPAKFTVDFDYSSETFQGRAGYIADLAALPVVAPPPTVTDGPATVSALKLRGRKLSATVTCAGTCPGVLTLRTSSMRIARLHFAGPGRLTTRISARALRHLRRHHTKALRVVLTTRGQATKVTRLRLR